MQAVVAKLPLSGTREGTDLTSLARDHLEQHPHFRGRLSGLRIEHRGKTLFLSGRLPSFYLKQLVQEAVRYLPGVGHVRNEIDVVNANGISSVRR
jgi:hypothetical protein